MCRLVVPRPPRAQPAISLRVRRVHALQVQRPYIHSALLDLERELPANIVVVTLLAYCPPLGGSLETT